MEGNIYQMGQVIGAGLAMMGAIGAGAGIGSVVALGRVDIWAVMRNTQQT